MRNESDVQIPYLTEATIRTQRVGIYLNDLKERLKDLRQNCGEVIQNSVDIIKEINDVSSTLRINNEDNNENLTKIKRLIREFENAQEAAKKDGNRTPQPPVDVGRIEIKKLLENFEKLNDSHLLRDSLLLFKRAKQSIEKIDDYLDKLNINEINKPSDARNCEIMRPSGSLRDKINMFNMAAEGGNQFVSCVSSATSVDMFQSVEEIKTEVGKSDTNNSMCQSAYEGYEGDVESDVDATAALAANIVTDDNQPTIS